MSENRRNDIFVGCFQPRPENLLSQISRLRVLWGDLASVITNLDTENFFDERLKVYRSIFPSDNIENYGKSTCRFQSFIGEMFHVHIHDHGGRRPPLSPSNLKSKTMNFLALAEKHPT